MPTRISATVPLISGAMVTLRTARTVPTTSVTTGRGVRSAWTTWTVRGDGPGRGRAGSSAQPQTPAARQTRIDVLSMRSPRDGQERLRHAPGLLAGDHSDEELEEPRMLRAGQDVLPA